MGNLIYSVKEGDWNSVRTAIQKLASIRLGTDTSPVLGGITIEGTATVSVLVATSATINSLAAVSGIIDSRDIGADGAQLDVLYGELGPWLDDVVLEDGGRMTTTQIATFAQLVLTPRASALSAVEGAMFYDSDDNNVYICTEGA